jgi:hypothetical protein
MKAWFVQDKVSCYGAEIVFAETRGKAKHFAMCTPCCDETRFTDIYARREPIADKYYKEGKWHLDWDKPQDRIALVKDCGFVCDYEYLEWEDCESCSAKKYCDRYKDHKESEDTE